MQFESGTCKVLQEKALKAVEHLSEDYRSALVEKLVTYRPALRIISVSQPRGSKSVTNNGN